MDMEYEAEVLLARIREVREDLNAGRLSPEQVRLYQRLGREVLRSRAA